MSFNYWDKPAKFAPMPENDIRRELMLMEKDPKLDTRISLIKKEDLAIPLLTFSEIHISYLLKHPNVNPRSYLMNLKAMIKIRSEK